MPVRELTVIYIWPVWYTPNCPVCGSGITVNEYCGRKWIECVNGLGHYEDGDRCPWRKDVTDAS